MDVVTRAATLALVPLDWLILSYFLAVNTWYAVLLVSAACQIRDHLLRSDGESRWRVLGSPLAPRITMLAPAHNEAATIRASVNALLGLYYANLELVVVNDGSTDATLATLVDAFDLSPVFPLYEHLIATRCVRAIYRSQAHPRLIVIDKDNGGKADALNAGLNLATGELVCALDADTLIERDALQRMVRPFLETAGMVAAGGTIRVINGSELVSGHPTAPRVPWRQPAGFQVVEYLRAFLFGRLGWNSLGGNLIISGAFGLFRRDAMVAVGGYAHGTVGEDMELVLRLRLHGYEHNGPRNVLFIPDPVAWTEVPNTLRVLGRQRDRWHRGLADALFRHRGVLFNPCYGALGMVVFPYFVFAELLAPIVELLGLLGLLVGALLGVVDVPFAVLFFLVAYGYGVVLTSATLVLEELAFARYPRLSDRLRLVGWMLLENFGYRQATVLWRIRGLIRFVLGRTDWGVMERTGFGVASDDLPKQRVA